MRYSNDAHSRCPTYFLNRGESVPRSCRDLYLVLGLTADDLDLFCLNRLRVVQFELDVLEYESPDFVTEAICVEMPLRFHMSRDEDLS